MLHISRVRFDELSSQPAQIQCRANCLPGEKNQNKWFHCLVTCQGEMIGGD